MSEYMKNVRQYTMTENMKKLCGISGMLEMLSCMEGCTVTSQMTSMLVDACEMIDDVTSELMKGEGQ